MSITASISQFWSYLSGENENFSMEHKTFNALCGVSFILLLVLLSINVFIGLVYLTLMVSSFLLILAFIFYLSRFRGRFNLATGLFAFFSYVILIINYLLNSGLEGPTLLYFSLTFILLITISPRRLHYFYLVIHGLIGLSLMGVEYFQPELIDLSYANSSDRYYDLGMSYIVTLIFLFLVINHLRSGYQQKKMQAEEKTRELKHQNKLMQEQKKEVEKLNEDKDKLFSMISHDFRSPLNTIQTYLELLNSTELSEQEQKDMRQKLLNLTKNTSSMLTNLLLWARSRMDGYKVSPQSISFDSIIDKCVRLHDELAQQKGIVLQSHIHEHKKVLADPEAIQAVFRNLVSNAIKYTPNNGKVLIEARQTDGEMEFTVEDTGVGMSLEQQRKLFSDEVESTIGTGREKGTGLGLKICQEIIEGHGGKMWIQSNRDEGTIVTFTLPIA